MRKTSILPTCSRRAIPRKRASPSSSTIGLMTKTGAFAQAALGAVLAAYGAYGLLARRFQVERASERWLSPLIGLVTGSLSGATGVFVIPTVPYLTSLKMTSEELVQS